MSANIVLRLHTWPFRHHQDWMQWKGLISQRNSRHDTRRESLSGQPENIPKLRSDGSTRGAQVILQSQLPAIRLHGGSRDGDLSRKHNLSIAQQSGMVIPPFSSSHRHCSVFRIHWTICVARAVSAARTKHSSVQAHIKRTQEIVFMRVWTARSCVMYAQHSSRYNFLSLKVII